MKPVEHNPLTVRFRAMIERISRAEFIIILTLLLLASTLGMTYVAVWGKGAHFYQREYGPAAMIAAGKGFVNPAPGTIPELEDFLNGRTESLALSDIPAEIVTQPLTQLQARWRYLLYTSGMLWMFFGISWQALLPLFGALFALTSLANYALFRVACGRGLSITGTLLCTLSPFNLFYLAFLRDYSKVPFVITTLAALAFLVSRNYSWRRRYTLIALLGASLGVGLGFRKDVVICIPPSVVVLAVLVPGSLRRDWHKRTFAIALLLLAFFTTSFPLLGAMREKGGTTSHVLILGLMEPFDKAMGVGNTPYTFGSLYRDPYAYSLSKDFAQQRGDGGEILYGTPRYDETCAKAYRWFAANFPADMLLRWYAAAVRTLNYGPFFTETPDEEWNPNAFVHQVFTIRWTYLGFMSGTGVLVFAASAIMLGARRVRLGLSYVFLVLYFTGYSSLQFSQRHFFHLECAVWWSLIASLSMLWYAIRSWRNGQSPQEGTKESRERFEKLKLAATRIGIVSLIVACAVVLPLAAARIYQAGNVGLLYDRYRTVELLPVASQAYEKGNTVWVSFGSGDEVNPSADIDFVRSSYFAIDFELERPVTIWPQYNAKDEFNDFSHRVVLFPRNEEVRLVRYFLPVFEASEAGTWGSREFEGFLIEKSLLPCVRGVYVVQDRSAFPVLIPMTLLPGELALAKYATLDPQPLPFYPRALLAHKRNLLTNGDFEVWDSVGRLQGFDYPESLVHVAGDYSRTTSGKLSARISWDRPTGPTSVRDRFRTKPMDLEGACEYEVFVDCYNSSENDLSISAWQLVDDGSDSTSFLRLSPSVVSIVPNKGFVTKAGRFSTAEGERASVTLVVSMQDGLYPAQINLDSLRLMKAN